MNFNELNALLGAAIVHGMMAIALLKAPRYLRAHPPRVVEMDVRKKEKPRVVEQPKPEPPKPEPPPPPPPKHVKRTPIPPPPETAPPPNREPPREPPKEPPKPVFGVTQESTVESGGISVPVGNTTVTDPKNTGKPSDARPLAAAPPSVPPGPPAPPPFRPAPAIEIKDYPDPDDEACKIPERLYPESARNAGLDGQTQLRVEIDEHGKVHAVKVLSGPGRILDDLAAQWMKARCRFKPAVNNRGQTVAATITYTYVWEIPR